MLKRLSVLLVAIAMVATILAGCDGQSGGSAEELTLENLKIVFIHSNDPSDQGFTFRQHTGITDTMAELGLKDEQVTNYFNIAPGDAVDSTILQAIEDGAHIIIGGTVGYGPHMMEAAEANPDITFLHATGNLALDSGLSNFHNFFGDMASARYLAGIAAGLRTETNVIGFVAAFPFAEVITGYTGFYLGALSVNPDVTMLVGYINSFNDPTTEQQITQALVDHGADVIGQHANSPSVQIAAEAAGVWGVGYNNDMRPFAPNATLVSPMFDWSVYFTYAIQKLLAGEELEADFLGTLDDGMVKLSAFNEDLIVPGTLELVEEARQRFIGGWKSFTGPLYDNEGNQLLADGEVYVERQAAPSWSHVIQGITIIE
ncbi:MAG: BMP family ABC transporter substrate-binding protein [Oscillospiraceae bacterium]|nr:BMP family ABC transporter substrate-binding protein [Oscillospiraceae bacterium]